MTKKEKKKKQEKKPLFSSKTKKIIIGLLLFLIAAIGAMSAIPGLAGKGGDFFRNSFVFLFGGMAALIPLLIFLCGLVFLKTQYEEFIAPLIAGFLLVLIGVVGFFTTVGGILEATKDSAKIGGIIGEIISSPLKEFLGPVPSILIFGSGAFIGLIIFWNLLYQDFSLANMLENFFARRKKENRSPSVMKKIFAPDFETQKIEKENIQKKAEEEREEEKVTVRTKKLLPPISLLEKGGGSADPGDTKRNSQMIKNTFANFDIAVEMSEINVGPTVTQYTLKPAEGIKLSKITSLSDDLALSLAKHPVRTEAPIPGKSLVGIEVPNEDREIIRIRDLLDNDFHRHASSLTLAIGKGVSGTKVYADMAKMPHLLVAGATGTGKTIFLNTLILSLIYKNSPENLRFILVDPKRVEFSLYKRLPHLLTTVIYDADKTNNALEWLIGEMERRFDVLAEHKKRNIDSYNEWAKKEDDEEVMPYIVLIVDELADLMAKKQNEIESGIVRIAQMARAVGIHLILATQRPSVEVITGLIKANITSRVSFQVASQVDSRTILDMGGAERLLGAGDMLFVSSNSSKPKRIQGSYVSEEEVKSVINWLVDKVEDSANNEDELSEDLEEELEKTPTKGLGEEGKEDPLYEEAKELVIRANKASASMIQRKLRVGYVRASRILDMLEARGVVGPSQGAKPRTVYGDNNQVEKEDQDEV